MLNNVSSSLGVLQPVIRPVWYPRSSDSSIEKIVLPTKKPGQEDFDKLLFTYGGLTYANILEICSNHFPCLNMISPCRLISYRNPDYGTYAKWIRKTKEVDKIHRGKSARMLGEEGVRGISLIGRMVQELEYFLETGGEHLDIKTQTICSGTYCASDGRVPVVGFHEGKVVIVLKDGDYCNKNAGVREVVPYHFAEIFC